MTRLTLGELPPKMQQQVNEKLGEQTSKPTRIPRAPSQWEASLALAMRALDIEFDSEYQFNPDRKWRFDFAMPYVMFAIEIEGTTHDVGRHQRKEGFANDLAKYQAAMLGGWTVYRCDQDMVKSGEAIQTIQLMLSHLFTKARNTNEKAG